MQVLLNAKIFMCKISNVLLMHRQSEQNTHRILSVCTVCRFLSLLGTSIFSSLDFPFPAVMRPESLSTGALSSWSSWSSASPQNLKHLLLSEASVDPQGSVEHLLFLGFCLSQFFCEDEAS
jgi:hypothetical protein